MRIHCPVCSTAITATEEHIGLKNRCVECSTKFVIPASEDAKIEILERGKAPDPSAPRPGLLLRKTPPPKTLVTKVPHKGMPKVPKIPINKPSPRVATPSPVVKVPKVPRKPIIGRLASPSVSFNVPGSAARRRPAARHILIDTNPEPPAPTAPLPKTTPLESATPAQTDPPRTSKLLHAADSKPAAVRPAAREEQPPAKESRPPTDDRAPAVLEPARKSTTSKRAALPRPAASKLARPSTPHRPAAARTAAGAVGSYLGLKVNRLQKSPKGIGAAIAVVGISLVVGLVVISDLGGSDDTGGGELANTDAPDPAGLVPVPADQPEAPGEGEGSSESGLDEPNTVGVDQWKDVIHPMLDHYCLDCHDEANEEGGLQMERFTTEKLALMAPEIWEKAAALVKMGSMPPRDRLDKPSDEERKKFLAWIDTVGERWDSGEFGQDPGRTTIRRLTKNEYNYTMRDLFGLRIRPADNFPEDGGGGDGFDNNADGLYLPPLLMENYVEAAGELVNAIYRNQDTYRRYLFAFPQSSDGLNEAARKVMEHWAPLLYRRPVEKSEIDALVALVRFQADKKKMEYRDAMKMPLLALLISPNFLYRSEKIQPGGMAYKVEDIDLASRLSYFLWSSTPDPELLKLAAEGKLSDPKIYEAQVRRLLVDDKAKSLGMHFAGQWLKWEELRSRAVPDKKRFPRFDFALRVSMYRESSMFFDNLVKENLPLLDLIDSDYTFLNQRLALHYDIPGVTTSAFRKVKLDDPNRGGVIGMGSVLTATSLPLRSSPAVRGNYVLTELLGTPPPAPPMNVPQLPEDDTEIEFTSFRDALTQHRKDPNCKACHIEIDQLGFGLENFDAIGTMAKNSWQISRRHVLRGVGATMGLPLLEAMLPSGRAFAAGAAGREGQPVRFAAFFMPHGVNHGKWDLQGDNLDALSPILTPLEYVKEYVNLFAGLRNASGGHNMGTSSFLTGNRPVKTADPANVNVGNASIDQIIGALCPGAVLPTLELGQSPPKRGAASNGNSHIYTSHISWKDARTPVPAELNPERAFDRLFKGVAMHVKAAGLRANPAPTPDKSVIDLVMEDARKLHKQVGRADQRKLDQYLTAVRDVEERLINRKKAIAGRILTRDISKEISVTRRAIRKVKKEAGVDELSVVPQLPYREWGQLLMDVMALAFWTNSTRSATMMFADGGSGRNMSFLEGVSGGHHSISHHGGKSESLEMFALINTFYMEQFAYFLKKLQSFKEGASNVLENSLVVFGSNMGDGQNHGPGNIPIVVAGRGGSRIRTGRHVRTGGSTGDLHRSIIDTFNLETNRFSTGGTVGAFKS